MPEETYIFERIEKKFLMSPEQFRALYEELLPHLVPDEYGKSTICNLYLDTPDFRLIRSSIEAVNYKEKLRVRSYGLPKNGDGKVFLELKKKFNGIVYKRRAPMTLNEALAYLADGTHPYDSQIMSEMDFARKIYDAPQPRVLLCYEREAFNIKDHPELRMTFDAQIRYRDTRVTFDDGTDGKEIFPPGYVLMEFKTDGAMPLFLVRALDRLKIHQVSVSKYGFAYQEIFRQSRNTENTTTGGIVYV